MTKSLALALLLLLTPAAVAALEPARGVVVQVTVDGTITQGVADYIEEALDYAVHAGRKTVKEEDIVIAAKKVIPGL